MSLNVCYSVSLMEENRLFRKLFKINANQIIKTISLHQIFLINQNEINKIYVFRSISAFLL